MVSAHCEPIDDAITGVLRPACGCMRAGPAAADDVLRPARPSGHPRSGGGTQRPCPAASSTPVHGAVRGSAHQNGPRALPPRGVGAPHAAFVGTCFLSNPVHLRVPPIGRSRRAAGPSGAGGTPRWAANTPSGSPSHSSTAWMRPCGPGTSPTRPIATGSGAAHNLPAISSSLVKQYIAISPIYT
eukprot:2889914-Pyramimonas_sp.AAC.2